MVAHRTAEEIHWNEAAAKRPTGLWGCWDCGNEDSYVRDTDKDAEHIRVRLRECTRCGARWETEERRISRGSFFGRAEKRRYAAFRRSRYAIRTCIMCKERYQASKYREHTQDSRAHRKLVAKRRARVTARKRRYQRQWMATKRALDYAQRDKMLSCSRCGGTYLEATYRTKHVHTTRHRAVLREQRNQRRRKHPVVVELEDAA